MRFYKYTFFKLFRAFEEINKGLMKDEYPEWKAFVFLSVLVSFNINLLLNIIIPETVKNINSKVALYIYSISIFILILLMNYSIFIKDKKHVEIILEFQNGARTDYKNGNLIVFTYVLFTIFSLFIF